MSRFAALLHPVHRGLGDACQLYSVQRVRITGALPLAWGFSAGGGAVHSIRSRNHEQRCGFLNTSTLARYESSEATAGCLSENYRPQHWPTGEVPSVRVHSVVRGRWPQASQFPAANGEPSTAVGATGESKFGWLRWFQQHARTRRPRILRLTLLRTRT
jgi:hypothetical protein